MKTPNDREKSRRQDRPPASPDAGAPPAVDLLRRIGTRVRQARADRGESRGALAARSGLSVRFLAQLEAGDANISVLRLLEVAQALGLELESLLIPSLDAALEPRRQIDSLLHGRSGAELREVREWLAARFTRGHGPLIALLGLRGAGKSSVGRKLAQQLQVPFFELDDLIEKAAGLDLAQIFELQGEAYFRRLEREVLARFLATTPAGVLATGGGLVTEPDTFALLRRRCTTIWLRAQAEQHWHRVMRQGDRRPMRDNPAAMAELRSLLAAREPLYAQADLTVDTSGRSTIQVAAVVERSLKARDPRS